MEFRAGATQFSDGVSILICERDYGTNSIGAIAKPLTIIMERYEPNSLISEPTLSLSSQEAAGLMNALWNAGVRPTDFKNPNGEINRLEDHLKDLRKLLFKE